MKEFLFQNKEIISLIIVGFELIILAFSIFGKKYKIVNSVKEFILEKLPSLISSAECLFSVGSDKKEYVLNSIDALLKDKFGIDISGYLSFTSKAIEKILSTPIKKGVHE